MLLILTGAVLALVSVVENVEVCPTIVGFGEEEVKELSESA